MKKAILLLLTLGTLAPLMAQADDHWNNRDDWHRDDWRRNDWRWHHRHYHHDWDDYNHEDWHHHHHYHPGEIIVVPD